MKPIGSIRIFLALAFCAVSLGTGCIVIPMGTETFTTEFPTVVRATWDSPTKTYEPEPVVSDQDPDHLSVSIVLRGTIVSSQPQEQHYQTVTVERQKRLAFGFAPGAMENSKNGIRSDGKKLRSTAMMSYKGNGRYEEVTGGGAFVTFLGSFCCLNIPVALLWDPFFGPWECSSHHWVGPNQEYLLKFSPAERKKIGAWTLSEQDEHPQNGGQSGFSHVKFFGFHRFCDYLIHDPVESKRTPVDPKVTTSVRTVRGPYAVSLSLPSLGYLETVVVEPDGTDASFRLSDVANGDAFANGTVLFSLPAEGLAAVRSADDRAMLERAVAQEWPVTIALPAPRRMAPSPPAPKHEPLYSITSIEHTSSGKTVIRVAINDMSKTFEIARLVQPDIRRLIRAEYLSRNPGISDQDVRESLNYETEGNGQVLVFTGWAFCVRPVKEGWSYDANSRHGWLRLRILGDMPATEAKRWARENISSIVTVNPGTEDGHPLPAPDAKYRILSESIKDGVLTVEFETIQ